MELRKCQGGFPIWMVFISVGGCGWVWKEESHVVWFELASTLGSDCFINLFKKLFIIVCVHPCMCVCVCTCVGHVHAMVNIWMSEHSFPELISPSTLISRE